MTTTEAIDRDVPVSDEQIFRETETFAALCGSMPWVTYYDRKWENYGYVWSKREPVLLPDGAWDVGDPNGYWAALEIANQLIGGKRSPSEAPGWAAAWYADFVQECKNAGVSSPNFALFIASVPPVGWYPTD